MESILISIEQSLIWVYENLHYILVLLSEWTLSCFKFLVLSFVMYNLWVVTSWIFNLSIPSIFSTPSKAEFDIEGHQIEHNDTLFEWTTWVLY